MVATAFDEYWGYTSDEAIKMSEHDGSKAEHEKNGRLAGTGAGVIAGAQLGSVLIPVPIIGTFTGAFVGGIMGSRFGKRMGAAISEKMTTGKSSGDALNSELERLAYLRQQGLLSEEEYKAAKAKLLNL